jgi:uncharacterized DUF497 family protein
MRFTSDITKNNRSVRRRGLAFQDAVRIFDVPTVEKEDDRYDYGELRIHAIGLMDGVEVTVIYTEHDDNEERHIISAWRSAPHERRAFWQEIESQAR